MEVMTEENDAIHASLDPDITKGREELILHRASLTSNAPMSRSRMNEVYGLLKKTTLVSGPRHTKPMQHHRNWERPLVPVSAE
jgi:hypothetical protein